MSTLWLLRHGQASFGDTDYDQLSPLGERQASATGAFLAARDYTFTRAIAGPRRRHAQTAALALSELSSQPALEIASGLDEFADAAQIMRAAHERLASSAKNRNARDARNLALYGDAIRAWVRGEIEVEGCVSAQQFAQNIGAWFDDLRARGGSGERVLAVTSAGTIAFLVCRVLDLPIERAADFMLAIGNTALTEIAFSGNRVGLRSFNSDAHLPPQLLSKI